jgi:uncharacterized protein YbaP (TraB family)
MKKSIVLLLLVCTHFLNAQENSLLWKVSGNGLKKPSYLYGTYHSKDARAHEFGDSVLNKLNESEVIVAENIYTTEADKKEVRKHLFMENMTLNQLLDSRDFSFVRNFIEEKAKSFEESFNTMKPLATLMGIQMLKERLEMEHTVDQFIKIQALATGKKLVGLETVDNAMESLDKISLKEQSKMLVDDLKEYNEKSSLGDTMVRMYQSQNIRDMYSFYQSKAGQSISFEQNLIVDRNKKFLKNLIPLMKQQSVFCAVGALHLPGETGLINSLRKKGYQVTPVMSKYTPKKLVIDDKRKWESYHIDSIHLGFSLPGPPTGEGKMFSFKDGTEQAGLQYSFIDSLQNMTYTMIIVGMPDDSSNSTIQEQYRLIIDKIGSAKNWKKIKEEDIVFQSLHAKEAEFNLLQGFNIRYRFILRGKKIYIIAVGGDKRKVYSTLAERFFENIVLTPCDLEILLEIRDAASEKLLKDFSVSIKSADIDTVLAPDTVGYLSFTLPSSGEALYRIKIMSKNHVSNLIEINTAGINKTGEDYVFLSQEISLRKRKAGVDYSIFDQPISVARLLDDSIFYWDEKYEKTMELAIDKQIK